MAEYGYIHAPDEAHAVQHGQVLEAAGAEYSYFDNDSAERPGLEAALGRTGMDDVLLVHHLDHLAPSGFGVLETIARIVRKGATLRVIQGDITVTPEDAWRALTLTAALAEIDARAANGAILATENAEKCRSNAGRPRSLSPEQVSHARHSVYVGGQSASAMARLLKVNKTTLWRALRQGC